jgi:hypothetical protein
MRDFNFPEIDWKNWSSISPFYMIFLHNSIWV